MKIPRWLLVAALAPTLALTTTLANAQGVWLTLPGLSTRPTAWRGRPRPAPRTSRS
ncbi:hypothetical protein WKI68_37515 [Streptomyces sp. MS1.HAVA.3]|uniref:Uncharacterized protein n=1 Tax=Streptomyces caledonius TaxID=3134107 RepID=A0ABU8UBW0_9ACTN